MLPARFIFLFCLTIAGPILALSIRRVCEDNGNVRGRILAIWRSLFCTRFVRCLESLSRLRMETNLPPWRGGRAFHQFANGVEDDFELGVVFAFEGA